MTRSAEELWERLVQEAGEDEIERAASVSVAQAEEELAEAGFDVAAERARAEALLTGLEGKPQLKVAGKASQAAGGQKRRRVPPVVWLGAAAAAAAAAAGVAVSLSARRQEGEAVPTTRAPGRDLAVAADLRRQAAAACGAGRAKECLTLLDRAKGIDPAGDATSEVQKLRETAAHELGPGAQ